MTYNGCRYQSYGEWSDKEVLWCFCNQSLCNVNITYIQTVYPGASSGLVQQQGQILRGQVKVSEGTGYWHRVSSGSGSSGSGGSSGSIGSSGSSGSSGSVVSVGSGGSTSGSRIITQILGQNQGNSGVRIQRIGLIVQGQGQDQSKSQSQALSSGLYQIQGLSDLQLSGQGYLIQSQSGDQVGSSSSSGGGRGSGQVSSGSYGVQGDIQGYLVQGQNTNQGQSGIQGYLVQGQNGNKASGSVYDLNDGSLLQVSQRPLVVDPIIYAVTPSSGGGNIRGGLLQPPVVVQGNPGWYN